MSLGMRSVSLVLLLSAAVPCLGADLNPNALPQHTFGMVAAEAGGSLIGAIAAGAAIGVGTMLIADPFFDDTIGGSKPTQIGLLVGGVAYPFGAAAGATLAGSWVKDDGRFVPSLLWAGSTAVLAGALVLGSMAVYDTAPSQKFRRTASDVMFTTGLLVEFLGVPAAACVGYVKGRPATDFGGRFLPGGFALRRSPGRGGNWEVAVQPVRVRF